MYEVKELKQGLGKSSFLWVTDNGEVNRILHELFLTLLDDSVSFVTEFCITCYFLTLLLVYHTNFCLYHIKLLIFALECMCLCAKGRGGSWEGNDVCSDWVQCTKLELQICHFLNTPFNYYDSHLLLLLSFIISILILALLMPKNSLKITFKEKLVYI